MAPDPTKPDAVALLPCPFCGAQPDARDIGPEWVECPSCGCAGPADPYRSREDAWNRRAALAQRPESAGEGAEVELSEDEIMECWEGCSDPAHPEVSIIALARAIERAHDITNPTKGDAR